MDARRPSPARRAWRAVATAGALLGLLLPASARGGESDTPVAAWKARVTALRHGELVRLEIQLAGAPDEKAAAALLPAVRIERESEIRTFLEHVEEAATRHVLVLGAPSPAVAEIRVEPKEGPPFVVDVTAHAFRSLGEASDAFVFQSPALLRWMEDRIETPQYDLRGENAPSLSALLERFRANTQGLTREAQAEDRGGPTPSLAPGAALVRNGGFEEALVVDGRPKDSPAGWDRVDGLTTFWREDPFPRPGGAKGGKALVMDTDVLESEWLRRKEQMKKDPDSAPFRKTLVPPDQQYATVGATYGVSYYSDPIPVVPGQAYRITLDFRAVAPDGGIAKVWVRGYGKLETAHGVVWRRIYDSLHTLRTDDPTWHEYTNVFHPTKNTPHVERMRVMLYGYWPRGETHWDDVRIVPISDAEYRKAKETERSDVK